MAESKPEELKPILDDVLILLAGQKFPTPEKGFTCWEDALSSLKRFIRESRASSPQVDAKEAFLKWFHSVEAATLMDAFCAGRQSVSPQGELISRLRAAVERELTYSDDYEGNGIEVGDRIPFEKLHMRDRALSAFDAELRSSAPSVGVPQPEANADVEAFWTALERSWEIEPRSYFEQEAPKNGFGSPLAMAVHYMWKREVKSVPQPEAIKAAATEIYEYPNENHMRAQPSAIMAIIEKHLAGSSVVPASSTAPAIPTQPESASKEPSGRVSNTLSSGGRATANPEHRSATSQTSEHSSRPAQLSAVECLGCVAAHAGYGIYFHLHTCKELESPQLSIATIVEWLRGMCGRDLECNCTWNQTVKWIESQSLPAIKEPAPPLSEAVRIITELRDEISRFPGVFTGYKRDALNEALSRLTQPETSSSVGSEVTRENDSD